MAGIVFSTTLGFLAVMGILGRIDEIVAVVGGCEVNLQAMIQTLAGESKEATLKISPTIALNKEQLEAQGGEIATAKSQMADAAQSLLTLKEDVKTLLECKTDIEERMGAMEQNYQFMRRRVNKIYALIIDGGSLDVEMRIKNKDDDSEKEGDDAPEK